jgi:hypothetical protein
VGAIALKDGGAGVSKGQKKGSRVVCDKDLVAAGGLDGDRIVG